MIQIDVELEKFLFPGLDNNEYPQRILAKQNKQAILWIPGNKVLNKEKIKWGIVAGDLIGYTGFVYGEAKCTKEAERKVFFLGIDIDNYNNYKKVHEILPEYSIRFSKSKKGLHLFRRIIPIKIAAGLLSNEPLKLAMQPDIKKLTAANIPVCTYGGNVFYFAPHGWLYKSAIISNIEIDFSNIKITTNKHRNNSKELIDINILDDNIKNLAAILNKHGIIDIIENKKVPARADVWVKQVYNVLKNTCYSFETKSPMKSISWEHNGVIEITPHTASIYTCSSKKWSTIWASF